MSRSDTRVTLQQMLDHAVEAVNMIRNKTHENLISERQLNLSIIRLLEIIGEAANRVPRKTREKYSDIHWGPIISLRNKLIHGYDSIDYDIIWQIVTKDLPILNH